jgi:hypothetical protein
MKSLHKVIKRVLRYEIGVFLKNSDFEYFYGSISYLFGYEKNRCFFLMIYTLRKVRTIRGCLEGLTLMIIVDVLRHDDSRVVLKDPVTSQALKTLSACTTMVVQRERMQGGKGGEDSHRKFNVEEGGGGEISSCCHCEIQGFQEECDVTESV